jgi:hypothetical protein
MIDFPIAIFDVASFTVDEAISESELLEVQNLYIKPILGDSLYADFLSNLADEKYTKLKSYAVNCAQRWLYYRSLSKKLVFKDFLENSAESPGVFKASIESAYQMANSASRALRSHVESSSYELYTLPTKKRVSGFLLNSTS